MRIVHRGISLVQQRNGPSPLWYLLTGILSPGGKEGWVPHVDPGEARDFNFWKKKGLTFDSSVYNHKIVNKSCVSRRKVMKPCHA